MATAQVEIEITERPILFNSEMVRAILEGKKTMTRRVIQPRKSEGRLVQVVDTDDLKFYGFIHTDTTRKNGVGVYCPYGTVGDRLWVRETFLNHALEGYPPVYLYAADGVAKPNDRKWRPSIFMPREACRITLVITNVRVERLQKITDEDARAEGVDYIPSAPAALSHRTVFAGLWDKLNAKRGFPFEADPFVWVIEFKKI